MEFKTKLVVIAIMAVTSPLTQTGRKAVWMIDDADTFGGGKPSHYVLY